MAPNAFGPTKYGRYELVKPLGMGGMAEVFLARTEGPQGFAKQVVIKRVLEHLLEDESVTEMFLDEARLAARLEHPNICQVFDLGEAEGQYFIAMEHVQGLSLDAVLTELGQRDRGMPLDASLRVITHLLEALSYAHSLTDEQGAPLKIVHRDVTPSNVMITPQAGVKLLDFGIARAVSRQHHTQAGYARGKLGYMPPEQIQAAPVDRRSDLFAVGAVLYLLATGAEAFDSELPMPELLRRMAEGEFPPPRSANEDLSPELEAIILKAMAVNPEARYRTAQKMQLAVEAFASAQGYSLGPAALGEVMRAVLPETVFDPQATRVAPALERPTSAVEAAVAPTELLEAPRKPASTSERARAASAPVAQRRSGPRPSGPRAPPAKPQRTGPKRANVIAGCAVLVVMAALAVAALWWASKRLGGGDLPPAAPPALKGGSLQPRARPGAPAGGLSASAAQGCPGQLMSL